MSLGDWHETNEWGKERCANLRREAAEYARSAELDGGSDAEPGRTRALLAVVGSALTGLGVWLQNQAAHPGL